MFGKRKVSYARTPDKNVDANVNALSACVNSPYRGGPAGCAAMLSFDTRKPAPTSSSPFFLSAFRDIVKSVQPLELEIQPGIAFASFCHTSVALTFENRLELH